jgi:hypothetical protein
MTVRQPLEQAEAQASSSAATVATDGADASAAIATVGEVGTAVGTPAVASTGAVAKGIFAAIGFLIIALIGSQSGSPPPPPPPPPTTTITTTSTTSTSTMCTATATETPVIILTVQGTTSDQYNNLVNSLPKNEANEQHTEWQPYMGYIATLNECQAENLTSNPLVLTWSIDAIVEMEGFDTATDPTSKLRRRHQVTHNENAALADHTFNASSNLKLPRAAPNAQSNFLLQNQSPGHLQWASEAVNYNLLNGDFYAFTDAIYAEPVAAARTPLVYVVDTWFQTTHEAFTNVLAASFTVNAEGIASPGNNAPTANTPGDPNHGTCMASLATGRYSSLGKHSRLVTVQMNIAGAAPNGAPEGVRASRVFSGFMAILKHAQDNGGAGNAVVSMSWG